ncbi:MAG: hypothetical protein P8M49_11015 [Thalassotalea sp.]|nr:hypothetical protein [Thalassotalea sp.]MDG2394035.1 hypothetical protein [Thalassotalea sp.]
MKMHTQLFCTSLVWISYCISSCAVGQGFTTAPEIKPTQKIMNNLDVNSSQQNLQIKEQYIGRLYMLIPIYRAKTLWRLPMKYRSTQLQRKKTRVRI